MEYVIFTFVCLLPCASHAHMQYEAVRHVFPLNITKSTFLTGAHCLYFIKVVLKQFPPSSSPKHDFEGSTKSILYSVV